MWWFHIGAGGQFLNSWNWGRQAPGSGIYRLGEDELDRREFAAGGNPLARPKSARCWAIEANLGRIRPPRIREGQESTSAQGGSEGRACWLPGWVRSTPANQRGSGMMQRGTKLGIRYPNSKDKALFENILSRKLSKVQDGK